MVTHSGDVLVVNTGSTSVKLKLFDRTLGAKANVRTEMRPEGGTVISGRLPDGQPVQEHRPDCATPERSLGAALTVLKASLGRDVSSLAAIGHRVVHGGEQFRRPALIDQEVRETIDRLARFAPLHNPLNRLGIDVTKSEFPGVRQVAVFDTAFHATIPDCASRYAIPSRLSLEHGFRRFGFHGISCQHVLRATADFLGRPEATLNLIIAHLGGGASITAVRHGQSVDTSMGFSPTEGLVMNTRCGDIDPMLPTALQSTGLSAAQVETALNRESGLAGLCGITDMRQIQDRAAQGQPDARLALDMYCYRLKKYIGAYSAVLGHVDACVFTGGIGENAAAVRALALEGLEPLGYRLNARKNLASPDAVLDLGEPESLIRILAVAADEEREIARQTIACLGIENSH